MYGVCREGDATFQQEPADLVDQCRATLHQSWAWVLPTVIISYKLFTFTDPHPSVLAAANPWSRFSYYFAIERFMPTLYDLRGSDPARVVEQITVVAPFYSGIAYSMGAVAQKHDLVERIITALRRQPEPELFLP